MNKLAENIIEITLVWARLADQRDLKDDVDSMDIKQSIIKYAQDFESKYRDITWDGDAFDYYLTIEKYGKQRLLDDYGREVEMGWLLNGEWMNPNSHVTVAWMPLPEPVLI